MSDITIGVVGGEKWVGTNNGGTGRLLFKLSESESVYDELTTLRQQNEELIAKVQLNTEILKAICERKTLQGSDFHAINCTIKNNDILLSKIKGDQDE